MITKVTLRALLFCSLSACASVHPGTLARPNEGSAALPLKVSVETIDRDIDSAFELVQVTYENLSNEWVRIAKTEALTGDPAKSHISVVVGKDLVAWAEAMTAKEDLERYNREMLQSGLLVAGAAAAVAGSASGNDGLAASGTAVMAGTTAWAAVDVISARRKMANSPRHVPDAHLYAETIVPPKLFLRRWLLFNKPAGTRLPWVVFTVETVEGKKSTYTMEVEKAE